MNNLLHRLKRLTQEGRWMIFLFSIMLLTGNLNAQNVTITGKVVSADGETLPGATVRIQGTTAGTVTDVDGNFSISAPSNAVLEISSVGFKTHLVPVENRTTIDITMDLDTAELDEVVVIGYGTQKKSHLTGSISKVTNEKLDQVAVSRVDEALIGQVSGVNVQATSAEPGAAPTITVRGFGTVNGSSGPAVVVDGVVVNSDFLGTMDMNNIASFEVLKDKASAAIYGSEGANGVIMITTKSGKAGKTKFSYETYTGWKEAFGSDDYRKSVADWAKKEEAEMGELSDETAYALLLVETTGIDRDWQDVFFNGGNVTSHSLSARGGNDVTKFNTSLRYLHDEGVVITDDYKLYTGNVKLSFDLSDKLKYGVSVTPSYSKRRALPTSIHNPIRQSPWLPIYHTEATLQFINRSVYPDVGVGDYFLENHLVNLDINGDGSSRRPRTSGDMNPYAQYVEREHYEYTTNLLGSTYLSYEIIDGLEAKTSLGITTEQRKRTRYDGILHHANPGNAAYELQNRYRTRLVSDNTLSYNKEVGNHEFDVLAGMTVHRRRTENSVVQGRGFSNDLIKNLGGATLISEYEEINFDQNKVGFFTRLNYAYANKYLLSVSIRRDGSSVFGANTKWGNFPAISAGWNASDEDFLSGSSFLSLLKVRASYGLTGNENFNVRGGGDLVNNYPYLSLLNSTNSIINGSIVQGFSPLNIANGDLAWESSREFNPGVDFGFFDNRITGSFDYYKRTSNDLLLANPVSYVTGFTDGIVNLGEVVNEGWEFELRTRNYTGNNFSWNSTLIAGHNKNTLTSFGESSGALLEDNYGRNSQWINQVGLPLSTFWGYVVDYDVPNEYVSTPYHPINSSSQDVVVKDLNGDGIITDDDKTVLGDPYPDLIWSFTNEFNYRNLDVSVMIQGSMGAQVRNVGDEYFFNWFGNATENPQQLVTDGLVPHISFIQEKVLTNEIVQDASYFSLRNVNIGYTFKKDQLTRFGLAGLRIYASGQNLIYKMSADYHGFNPEFVDDDNPRKYGEQRAGTPLFRTYTLGLNLNF